LYKTTITLEIISEQPMVVMPSPHFFAQHAIDKDDWVGAAQIKSEPLPAGIDRDQAVAGLQGSRPNFDILVGSYKWAQFLKNGDTVYTNAPDYEHYRRIKIARLRWQDEDYLDIVTDAGEKFGCYTCDLWPDMPLGEPPQPSEESQP
jgi:hypothetical protein